MAKICINPNCEREIPSTAVFCSFCGTQQVENENLSEEEKLHKELSETGEMIELLEKSLADAHSQIENGTADEEIQGLKNKLMAEQANQTNLQNQITAKDKEIEQLELLVNKKDKSGGFIIFIILLFLATVILSVVCFSLNNEVNQKQNEQKKVQERLDNLRQTFPLRITRIELANTDNSGKIIDDFGSKLYRSRLMYLNPKIHFDNYLENNKTFNFEIHYVDAWGRMEYNTGSGKIPTSENYISTADASVRLSGWGSNHKGNWKSGAWTVEIWYNDVCLGRRAFTIY
ncbi:MAG: hypothetical protein LBE91_07450 [Tannerella sp.]|jgi:hypothetical protein|nr:hypothetical protein [Tannerella sp.]